MTVDLIGIDGSIKLNKSTFNATFNKPITLKYTYLEVIISIYYLFVWVKI